MINFLQWWQLFQGKHSRRGYRKGALDGFKAGQRSALEFVLNKITTSQLRAEEIERMINECR